MLCFSLMVVKLIRSPYWYKERYEKNMYFCVCMLLPNIVHIQLCESIPAYNQQIPNGGRLVWRGYSENEWLSWEHMEGLIGLMS